MWKVAGTLFLLTSGVCAVGKIAAAGSGNAAGSVGFMVVMGIFAAISFALGLSMVRIKPRKLTPQEKEAAARTLTCRYAGGLPLEPGCFCTVRFEDSEIVICVNESTFRVPYEKTVSLKIETKVNVQRRWGYSIPGAVLGGAAFGPAGAGLLGVKEKKRRTVEEYLVVSYNPRENAVSALVFLPADSGKMRRLIAQYAPRCNGRASDVTL